MTLCQKFHFLRQNHEIIYHKFDIVSLNLLSQNYVFKFDLLCHNDDIIKTLKDSKVHLYVLLGYYLTVLSRNFNHSLLKIMN